MPPALSLRKEPAMLGRSWILSALTLGLALCVVADEGKNLLKETNKTDSWRFEQHEGGKGKMEADGEAILFEVTDTDGTDWHVQAVQTGLDLKEQKEYVLSFRAKASADRQVPVNAMIDQDDWHQIGLSETADVGKEWKEFRYEFRAEQVLAKKDRISFILGGDKGKLWLKDVKLVEKP
jgi:hypothetical protein